MESTILYWLLVASWLAFLIAFIITYRWQSRMIKRAIRSMEDVRAEERRVFEFLHVLGEAFSSEVRAEDLHRLIVEGAVSILNAHGGALYLTDRGATVLVNRYVSKNCPPLVEVPPHILAQAESTPQALQGYLRLHVIVPGEGLVGQAWSEREPMMLVSGDPRLERLRELSTKTGSAMLVPLDYGRQALGVLAIARGPMSAAFTASDFEVFKSIAEQSAFALYSAFIYLEASEKKRLDADLQIAQEIQRILLPSTAPDLPGFEIAGINIAARQVSGDYYDYLHVNESHLGVAIADVSGKGVPASLIMAMCRSVLHSHAPDNTSPSDVLQKVNRQLFPDIKEDMFISMAYVILDSRTGEVVLCRAGHDAPLLYSAREQTITKLKPSGMALGIDGGDVFNRITGECAVHMEPGDCLILYTDGVTEALDSNGMEYGLTKTIQSIQVSAGAGARAVIDRVTDDVQDFIGTMPRSDDITLIVIRKK